MGKREEYWANAAECMRRANLIRDATDKRAWFDMAQNWLGLMKLLETAQDGGWRDRSALIAALQVLEDDQHRLTEERRAKEASTEQPPLWLRSRNLPQVGDSGRVIKSVSNQGSGPTKPAKRKLRW